MFTHGLFGLSSKRAKRTLLTCARYAGWRELSRLMDGGTLVTTREAKVEKLPILTMYPTPIEFLCCETWLEWPEPGEQQCCPECGTLFELNMERDA